MRILHVAPTYWPAMRYGGPTYSVHGLARATAARGHEVHVFTTNVDGPGVSDVPLGVPVALDGVTVWYSATGAGRRLFRAPAMGRLLAERAAGFDVLHLHSVFLWPTLTAARIARRAGRPYVVSPRGMLVGDLITKKSRLAKSAWINIFEAATIRHAAAIHVTSEVERVEIKKLGLVARRFAVIPNGIDMPPAVAVVPSASQQPYVLALGRINWKKGLDRLIAAMVHVPDTDLLIVGNDEEGLTPKLEAIASRLGLSHRVRFSPPVHGDAKWQLLGGAAVLALASYSENFGNVVLEAMAAGVPVAVTPEVGLAADVQAAGAGIVADGAPDVFGPALRDLLSQPARLAAFGAAGREAAIATYSWEAVAAQMEGVYRHSSAGAVQHA